MRNVPTSYDVTRSPFALCPTKTQAALQTILALCTDDASVAPEVVLQAMRDLTPREQAMVLSTLAMDYPTLVAQVRTRLAARQE